MPSARTYRLKLARLAAKLHARFGDSRFASACGVLSGAKPGRPPAPDDEALKLAASLYRSGLVKSKAKAALRAAIMTGAASDDVDRQVERLRKKIGDK